MNVMRIERQDYTIIPGKLKNTANLKSVKVTDFSLSLFVFKTSKFETEYGKNSKLFQLFLGENVKINKNTL